MRTMSLLLVVGVLGLLLSASPAVGNIPPTCGAIFEGDCEGQWAHCLWECAAELVNGCVFNPQDCGFWKSHVRPTGGDPDDLGILNSGGDEWDAGGGSEPWDVVSGGGDEPWDRGGQKK